MVGSAGAGATPTIYDGSLTINKRVCLTTASSFWFQGTGDWRYGATLRSCGPSNPSCSTPTASFVVDITPAGSGSCLNSFKLDHRGTGPALRIGQSGAAGPAIFANDVTFLNNFVDVTQSLPAVSAHGMTIAGKGNGIYRNVVVGSRNDLNAGVLFPWNAGDPSLCSDWDGNQVNGNFLSGFGNGVFWFLEGGGLLDCAAGAGSWTNNRIDFNDISGCSSGINSSTTGARIRLAVMENNILDGALYSTAWPWSATPPFGLSPCEPDRNSNGIQLRECYQCDVTSNRVSNVNIGIHLGYGSCNNRVSKNHIRVSGASNPSAIWVCPSTCNLLTENELSGDGAGGVVTGVNFSNREQSTCRPVKVQGTHFLDGGIIRDLSCITRQRTYGVVTLLTSPARTNFTFVDCP